MDSVIYNIAKAFKQANVSWGIGGSKLLSYYGITNIVNDLDIVIKKEDLNQALNILQTMGEDVYVPKKHEYLTENFHRFKIDHIEVDVMSNFKIQHTKGIFDFVIDTEQVTKKEIIKDIELPLTSLEQWYIAYLLMKKREEKIIMIEKYFIECKTINKVLLQKYMQKPLPLIVKNRITLLLNNIVTD